MIVYIAFIKLVIVERMVQIMTKKHGLLIKFCTILCVIGLLTSSVCALDVTGGFMGINSYSGNNCKYGDRAGVNYCTNLELYMDEYLSSGSSTFTRSYFYKNSSVTPSVIYNASTVDFFAYSGHGLSMIDKGAASAYANSNSLHTASSSSSASASHSNLGETSTQINALTQYLTLRHKYVTIYSCNWLTNGGSTAKQTAIFNMLNGTRLMMGFASTMYLDSREGTMYGSYMKTKTIVNAFTSAASYYQPQRAANKTTYARVMGYTSAKNDRITAASSYAPSYSSYPSAFSTIVTVPIACNGKTI